MAIIAVFNQKGGVGKTTTALNLLAGIARRGRRPWGIDLDPQAHLSRVFGAAAPSAADSMVAFFAEEAPLDDIAQITRSGVILCPAHGELGSVAARLGKGLGGLTRLRHALRAPKASAGTIVIDCSCVRDALALNAIFASDLVLVPVSCDAEGAAAAQDVERTLNAVEKLVGFRQPRRYLLTRHADGQPLDAAVARQVAAALRPEELCATRIRECPHLAQQPAGDVFRHAPDSRGAHDYEALVDELARAGFIG